MQEKTTLQFLGAAGTVTGSKYLLTKNGKQFLLECGLFQGLKELRMRNWKNPPFDPAKLSAVIISHAHIDHSGYLPLLAKLGYRGKIYCTPATRALLHLLLPDSAHLQIEEAQNANRHGWSKHKPALPLYGMEDAQMALSLLAEHPFHEPLLLDEGIQVTYRQAGHILGAATVELKLGQSGRLAFSGDLGRPNRPILPDPEPIYTADTLLLESTYGDRKHFPEPEVELARIIRETAARQGTIVVPAFAVGRTQELIWRIRHLEDTGLIPKLPVFVDSPMAIHATEIYGRADLQKSLETHDFQLIQSPEGSKGLNGHSGPMIIISASGMATGGRVLHHLRHRLPDPKNTILLVGFQAEGTRGRALQDGTKKLRMFGEEVPVNARIENLDGLSAHADRDEILNWLRYFKTPPRQVYLVHGEKEPAESLATTIKETLGWKVRPAIDGEVIQL